MTIDTSRVRFTGMDASEALEARIRSEIEALSRLHPDWMRCDVTVAAPHQHQHKGSLYEVRIDVVLRGRELVINREPGHDHAHEDPFVAVRDAFEAARRRVQRDAERHHSDAKRGAAKIGDAMGEG